MKLGVFVGGLSGGLISAQLIGIPGTPSAVATTFDGFPMARAGKPGLALGLGIVLILIVLALNAGAYGVKEAAQRRSG